MKFLEFLKSIILALAKRAEEKRRRQFQQEVDDYNRKAAESRARANDAMLRKWSNQWNETYEAERKFLR